MPRGSQKKPTRQPAPPHTGAEGSADGPHKTTPDVDPRWLLKMLALVLGAALLCGYLTLCLLFYQGQWQFILHPDTASKITPAAAGLAFEDVSFDFTEAGRPQLHGWWIPAPPTPPGSVPSRYSAVTVLYLHGGNGSLADTLPRLAALHAVGLNIFAFDYRGFGSSTGPHPNEHRMREDTAAAWQYLTHTRKVPVIQLIPYGEGVGTALAAQLLSEHPRVRAAIFDGPIFDVPALVRQDPRTRLVPLSLLLRERFDAATPLATVETPKLLLVDDGPYAPTPAQLAAVADPKFILHTGGFTPEQASAVRSQSITRFLDEYLPDMALVPQ